MLMQNSQQMCNLYVVVLVSFVKFVYSDMFRPAKCQRYCITFPVWKQ